MTFGRGLFRWNMERWRAAVALACGEDAAAEMLASEPLLQVDAGVKAFETCIGGDFTEGLGPKGVVGHEARKGGTPVRADVTASYQRTAFASEVPDS